MKRNKLILAVLALSAATLLSCSRQFDENGPDPDINPDRTEVKIEVESHAQREAGKGERKAVSKKD